MKKQDNLPHKFDSLTDAHRFFGITAPKHPLISLINGAHRQVEMPESQTHILSFYKISYKPKLSGRLKYGQSQYDFDEGGMLFAAPGQIIGNNEGENRVCSQYTLLIHPDFFLGFPLAKGIKQYGYFSYSTNEALHLSEDEMQIIMSIFRMIETELNSRIDELSQNVVMAQIELMLNYANRFYKRQFITRKPVNNTLLQQLEDVLNTYFNNATTLRQGIPTVHYLANELNLTPSYLSDMLRSLTGQNAQQHIHQVLIEKAKIKLSTTASSVSEIAYALGFEHPQSFSKLFKSKTKLSPLEFRQSFN